MEAPEVPTEHLHEHMEHSAEESGQKWVMGVALTSALLAGLAAAASLMAGHHANEAMIDQIKAADQWNYYQAKGIKAAVLNSKMELLQGQGHKVKKDDKEKLGQYKDDQDEIMKKAKKEEEDSEAHLAHHVMLAKAVTFFQVAIAVGAISALTRKRAFWLVSMGFGAIGAVFFMMGLLG